jgi:hypothetical protein
MSSSVDNHHMSTFIDSTEQIPENPSWPVTPHPWTSM